MGKFKRLPNGFGNISRLPGKRRNPYRARIEESRTLDMENGRVIRNWKVVGYFPTYQDALIHLTDYHKDPYNLDAISITWMEVYEKWSSEAYPSMGKSNIHAYTAANKVCESIYDKKFVDIKYQELQHIIDTCGKNYPTLRKIKLLFIMIYKWADKNDITSNNQAQYVDISKYKDKNPNKIDRSPFTKEDVETMWKWSDQNEYVGVMLMMVYTGIRQGELRDLKKEDVHLSEQYFYIPKSKTPSGIRNVPICDKVLPFFEYWMNKNQNSEFLVTTREGRYLYDRNFRDAYWTPILDEMGISTTHRPHDTRHTFISLMTKNGIDERIIKKIVGHSGKGVTENVYTHLEMQTMLDAVNIL